MTKRSSLTSARLRRLMLGVSTVTLISTALPNAAQAFEWSQGPVSGSFDTTISVGATVSTSGAANDLVGQANGGARTSINTDDGRRNYDSGLVSLAARVTHEMSADYENVGAFARMSYFYDWVNADKSSDRGARTDAVRLSDEAQESVGRDFDLLDAYVYGNFDVDDTPIDIRVGSQVLSWGESTFIQNGINTINPIEVSAIRIPGSELKNALVPVPMVSTSVGVTDNLSLEGFFQFEWDATTPDAAGTFFSNNDFASPGGDGVYLGFGNTTVPDNGVSTVTAVTPLGSRASRAPDRNPDDLGQFGLAGRYYAPELNDTEFGFYYMNYHSRLPVINAHTGSLADLQGTDAANYAAGTNYFNSYEEDIQLIGASFNTLLAGISVQGEISHRFDQPLQIDDVELLQAALAPGAVTAAAGATATACAGGVTPTCTAAQTNLTNTTNLFNTNQVIQDIGGISAANAANLLDSDLDGFRKFNVTQAQATMTSVNDPMLGADQWVFVGEFGLTYVHDLPDADQLRFEAGGTSLGGNPAFVGVGGMTGTLPSSQFATAMSYGYRMRARFDYLNAIGPINLFPVLSFSHDLSGNTPAPLGNFREDRKAFGIGVEATYLDSWSAQINYTNFFGGEDFNLQHDRDFLSMNVKYSF